MKERIRQMTIESLKAINENEDNYMGQYLPSTSDVDWENATWETMFSLTSPPFGGGEIANLFHHGWLFESQANEGCVVEYPSNTNSH